MRLNKTMNLARKSVRNLYLITFHLVKICVEIFIGRLSELAAVQIISAADLAARLDRLGDILQDVFGGVQPVGIRAAKPHRRREAVLPIHAIVDGAPLLEKRLARLRIRRALQGERSLIDEAVKMDGFAVLVELWHEDVFHPVPPHHIVKPNVDTANDRAPIVARKIFAVQRERQHHIAIMIARREVKNALARST